MSAIITGQGLVSGSAEGTVLRTKLAFSFIDDVDAGTGVVKNRDSDIFGEALYRRILVIPQAKERGFTEDSLAILANYKGTPAAIIAEEADELLVAACENAGIPLIDSVDCDSFRTGDTVIVDADEGQVELVNVVMSRVATSVLFNARGELLIVQRSGRVGSHRGDWSCISGYVEEGETTTQAAIREVEEETGLDDDDVVLVGGADVVIAREDDQIWEVHPFAFKKTSDQEIELDWENVEYRWATLEEIIELEGKGIVVPRLKDVAKRARDLLK